MRRVLDSLVWVFLTGLVCGSFWLFSDRGEPEPAVSGLHSASKTPGHVEKCRSCLYYLGRLPDGDPWSPRSSPAPTVADSGRPAG